MTLMTGDEKHSSSATSTLDVLWALYDGVLNITPENPSDPLRDRFLLSKGHGPMAYYAVLAKKGYLPLDTLPTFGSYASTLGQHPDRTLIPGVEISSGSLGHGLPIALGVALGLRAADVVGSRVFCLIGDAELDEGSNFEAICLAGRLGLENLIVIVIDNHSASHGWPGGIEKRFIDEGWDGRAIDGTKRDEIEHAFQTGHPGRPLVVVAMVVNKGSV